MAAGFHYRLNGSMKRLLLLSALSLSGCSTLSGWWSDGGGEPEQRRVQAAAPVTASGNIAIDWRNNLDQRSPASPPGFSLPAEISLGGQHYIVAGAQDRRLRIYRSGGGEVDRIALGGAVESGALQLKNGRVVVGDVGGMLYGIDIAARRIVWQRQLSAALTSSPIVADDGFIVQLSNNQLFRFTADGEKVWSVSGQVGGLGTHLTPAPVLYHNRVYAVLSNGDAIAVKAADGSFLWKRQLLLSNNAEVMSEIKVPQATPMVIPAAESERNEDILLVGIFQGLLHFLSLQDGSTLDSRAISVKSKPLLNGHTIYVADAEGAVSALAAGSGETIWKQTISDAPLSGLVLRQGLLWLADANGRVFRLNTDGKLLASIELDGRIDRAPVAASNGVLVRNSLGTLYLLD